MSKDLIKSVFESEDKETILNLVEDTIVSKLDEKLQGFKKTIAETILTDVTEEVSDENAFVSVISESLGNSSEVNVDLPDGNRIIVSEDIAKILSETHDSLPSELQKSFRDMVFESEEKFTSVLEAIVSGDNDGQ